MASYGDDTAEFFPHCTSGDRIFLFRLGVSRSLENYILVHLVNSLLCTAVLCFGTASWGEMFWEQSYLDRTRSALMLIVQKPL